MRGFFENGGRRCWVVRVASDDPLTGRATSATTLPGGGGPVWRVNASSPGVWGDQLTVVVRETNRAQVYSTALDPEGRWSTVPRVAGFSRATLVRLTQAGSPLVLLRTVAAADPVAGRLHWVHPEPGAGLPYDAPVLGFDVNTPVLLETVDYRLLVSEAGRLLRVHEDLSTVPESDRYGPALLPPIAVPIDPVTGEGRIASPEPIVLEELRASTSALTSLVVDPAVGLRLTGGRAGLAPLVVNDFIGEPFAADDDVEALLRKRRGLRAVEQIAEVGLIAVPDIQIHPDEPNPTSPLPPCVPDPCLDQAPVAPAPVAGTESDLPPVFPAEDVYRVQAEMVLQCERLRDRFALLDAPLEVALDPVAGVRGVLDWRSRFDTDFAALSYPWLVLADPQRLGRGPAVGAVRGHVAGVVAATDLETGVPPRPGQPPHRLGARSQRRTSATSSTPCSTRRRQRHPQRRRARSAPARRAHAPVPTPTGGSSTCVGLMSMIEKALDIALQWAVFEPNGFLTRARATMSVDLLPRRAARGRDAGGRDARGVVLRAAATSTTTPSSSATSVSWSSRSASPRRSRSSSSCCGSAASATPSRSATWEPPSVPPGQASRP